MNRRELVNAVAAHTGSEPREVDRALKGVTEVITAVVAKGEPVNISGFAKFARQDRPARMGRNPATGEAIKIKASKKAKITPLKAFKDMVLAPSSAPKLAKGVWPPAPAGAPATRAARAQAPAAKPTATKATATKAPAAKAPAAKAPAAKPTATKATAAKATATKATAAKAPATKARPATRAAKPAATKRPATRPAATKATGRGRTTAKR